MMRTLTVVVAVMVGTVFAVLATSPTEEISSLARWLPDVPVLWWSAGLRVSNYALSRWRRATVLVAPTVSTWLQVSGLVGFGASLAATLGYWWLTDWRQLVGLVVVRFGLTLPVVSVPDRLAVWQIAMVATWPR